MRLLFNFFNSVVGKKYIMAITGLILIGFLVGHMAGNLKIFTGFNPSTGIHHLDEYAHFLREIGEKILGHGVFLWIARIILLGSIFLHIGAAVTLAQINRRARPTGYLKQRYVASTIASRYMLVGGLIISLFIIVHIGHFTTGWFHHDYREGQVYRNVVSGFASAPYVIFYLVALTAVAFHVYHGGWSLLQTLGIIPPNQYETYRVGARVLAVFLWVGFIVVPLCVYLGVLK
jgi:succinate dehydrogenase / fumarate reductase cytochrome b subunit